MNKDDKFGHQCDALTKKGKRCKKSNQSYIPCEVVYDARVSSYKSNKFKPVRLCRIHGYLEFEYRNKKSRMPLIEGGFLGGFNKYNYGNLVTDSQNIDWNNPTLKVPKYWSIKEDKL